MLIGEDIIAVIKHDGLQSYEIDRWWYSVCFSIRAFFAIDLFFGTMVCQKLRTNV